MVILREATIKYKGYDPDSLTKGSHKRICCTCDGCNKIRYVEFKQYKNLCLSCKQKNKNNPFYGKHHSDKTKAKISKANSNKCGEKSSNWKGGISNDRLHVLSESKCLKINSRFKESEFHHLNKNIGVYIPKELHRHIWHNLLNGQGIESMNILALQFINGEL